MKRVSMGVAAAALAAAMGAGPALASPLALSSPSSDTISADGVTVSVASCTATAAASCGSSQVNFYTDPATHDLALAITGSNGGTLMTAGNGVAGDLTVNFDVVSTTNISGIILDAAGGTTGGGTAGVGETITDNTNGFTLASGSVSVPGSQPYTFSSNDFQISKDIHVTGNGGTATVSSVDQVLQGVQVPAPAGLALFAPAAALLGFIRRRRV